MFSSQPKSITKSITQSITKIRAITEEKSNVETSEDRASSDILNEITPRRKLLIKKG